MTAITHVDILMYSDDGFVHEQRAIANFRLEFETRRNPESGEEEERVSLTTAWKKREHFDEREGADGA